MVALVTDYKRFEFYNRMANSFVEISSDVMQNNELFIVKYFHLSVF